MSRLDDLRELRDALRPQVLEIHSEHGLQGASGLVGQYVKVLAEIEELEGREPAAEGTGLDEFTRKLAEKQAAGSSRSSGRRQSR